MKDVAYIVGRYCNQNELLADYLSKKTNIDVYQKKLPDISQIINHKTHSIRLLILFDWLRNNFKMLHSEINDLANHKQHNVFYCIFNFDYQQYDIKDLLYCGIHGVFFDNDKLDIICKGVKSVLKGELWYSRNILAECLTEGSIHFIKSLDINNNILTKREKEILHYIVSGHKNNEIANLLGVSVNTVKTHIYKLYQKIHVQNRAKASLWALKNCPLPYEMKHKDNN